MNEPDRAPQEGRSTAAAGASWPVGSVCDQTHQKPASLANWGRSTATPVSTWISLCVQRGAARRPSGRPSGAEPVRLPRVDRAAPIRWNCPRGSRLDPDLVAGRECRGGGGTVEGRSLSDAAGPQAQATHRRRGKAGRASTSVPKHGGACLSTIQSGSLTHGEESRGVCAYASGIGPSLAVHSGELSLSDVSRHRGSLSLGYPPGRVSASYCHFASSFSVPPTAK